MDKNIGMKLDGRYELLELIGVGGMADIYKAKDTAENRTVAVKILKNEFAGSEDFLRRFRNESKAIALLSHENIVKIFDVGFDKSNFIVMEYIDGITLTDFIDKQGVLKWRDALGFTLQILKALQHAHDRGIVHRDIKAQNVMLLKDGTIKVMDFGIARFNREIDKTMSEKAIGSVHYISPEQARGDVTDEKSDLYSVGILLYEMLTGVKPFDGSDPLAIALMHTNKQPKRPSEINSSIPEGLEEITMRAMQKETAKRYQTAGEMMNDLREFEKNPSIVFEYKYFSPDGRTKYFDKVGKAVPPSPPPRRTAQTAAVQADYDDEDEDYDDEVVERRSPLLPILFAVASVFVILSAWLIFMLVKDLISPGSEGGGLFNIGSENNRTKMPFLVGMTWDEAMEMYGSEINFSPVQKFSSDYENNVIMDQSVDAGIEIAARQVIEITVSKGPELMYLPNYYSPPWNYKEAENDLKNVQSMKVSFHFDFNEDVPKDYVFKTEPDAGERLEKGDVVFVYVSQGPENPYTKAPDLVTLTVPQAEALAEAYEVVLEVIDEASEEVEEGKVIRQEPPFDEEMDKGGTVQIFVSTGPPEEEEPEAREYFLKLAVTDKWSGDYIFTYYVDGKYDHEERIDIGIMKEWRWEFSNSGVHLYTVKVKCVATGKEGTYCTYEIDFTKDPPKKTAKELNKDILKEISKADSANPPPPDPDPEPEPYNPDDDDDYDDSYNGGGDN